MYAKDILLNNLSEVFDSGGDFQPSDSLLDQIWKHILKTTDDKGILMSDVIDGQLDDELIAAASGSLEDATRLHKRTQELFRDWAYIEVEDYESDARALLREPRE